MRCHYSFFLRFELLCQMKDENKSRCFENHPRHLFKNLDVKTLEKTTSSIQRKKMDKKYKRYMWYPIFRGWIFMAPLLVALESERHRLDCEVVKSLRFIKRSSRWESSWREALPPVVVSRTSNISCDVKKNERNKKHEPKKREELLTSSFSLFFVFLWFAVVASQISYFPIPSRCPPSTPLRSDRRMRIHKKSNSENCVKSRSFDDEVDLIIFIPYSNQKSSRITRGPPSVCRMI